MGNELMDRAANEAASHFLMPDKPVLPTDFIKTTKLRIMNK